MSEVRIEVVVDELRYPHCQSCGEGRHLRIIGHYPRGGMLVVRCGDSSVILTEESWTWLIEPGWTAPLTEAA